MRQGLAPSLGLWAMAPCAALSQGQLCARSVWAGERLRPPARAGMCPERRAAYGQPSLRLRPSTYDGRSPSLLLLQLFARITTDVRLLYTSRTTTCRRVYWSGISVYISCNYLWAFLLSCDFRILSVQLFVRLRCSAISDYFLRNYL